jgi:signal transduction histidine kinase/DNA-binding response OmpR family regulator
VTILPRHFRTRYLVPLLGLLAAVFIVLVYLTVVSQRRVLDRELARSAANSIRDLARRAEVALLLNDIEVLRSELRGALAANSDADRGAFVDSTGSVIVEIGAGPSWPASVPAAERIVRQGNHLVASTPIHDASGAVTGTALLAVRTDRVAATVRRLAVQVLAGSVLGFVAVAALAAILLRHVQRLAITLEERVEQRTRDLATMRAEAESTALFATLNPSPVIRFDHRGGLLWANPEARALLVGDEASDGGDHLLGAIVPELAGLDWGGIITSDRRVVLVGTARSRSYQIEIRGVAAQGFGHAYFADISGLKRVEADLAEARDRALDASRLKSEFLANMSHEVRTPLNGVVGMLSLLGESPLNDKQQTYVRTAANSAQVLLTVIDDILDFSKIEAGKLSLEKSPFDLRDAVEEVGQLLSESAHGKGLELSAFIDLAVPAWIVGDSVRVRQVLLNLGGNAVKFTAMGEVSIHCSVAGGRLRFEVRDSGIGIAPTVRAKLFQPFSQADSSTTREFGGTGLGLSISRRLVELMDGAIGVESEEGWGSTFWFEIPLAPAAGGGSFPSLGGRAIMIVDRSETVRRGVEAYLVPLGARVVTAGTPAEAVASLTGAGARFDVLIVDEALHGGFLGELARRDDASDPRALPRCVVSTKGGRGRSKGLDQLPKPVRLAGLLAAVTGRRSAQRAEPASRSVATAGNPAPSPRQVLVVEDNEINRLLVVEVLEMAGMKAAVVVNGAEAITARFRERFDLILMDCQMPVMDGFAATRAIRAREAAERLAPIPIIALTANALEDDREACLAAGMTGYLAKPYPPAALLAAVREAGSGRPDAN